jgi:hypothetical protein
MTTLVFNRNQLYADEATAQLVDLGQQAAAVYGMWWNLEARIAFRRQWALRRVVNT